MKRVKVYDIRRLARFVETADGLAALLADRGFGDESESILRARKHAEIAHKKMLKRATRSN